MKGTPAAGCLVPNLSSIWATPGLVDAPTSSAHQVAVKPHLMEEDTSPLHPQPSILWGRFLRTQNPEHAPLPGHSLGILQAVRV